MFSLQQSTDSARLTIKSALKREGEGDGRIKCDHPRGLVAAGMAIKVSVTFTASRPGMVSMAVPVFTPTEAISMPVYVNVVAPQED